MQDNLSNNLEKKKRKRKSLIGIVLLHINFYFTFHVPESIQILDENSEHETKLREQCERSCLIAQVDPHGSGFSLFPCAVLLSYSYLLLSYIGTEALSIQSSL